MISVDYNIWIDGRKFYGGEIGFNDYGSFCLDLYTTSFVAEGEGRGSYFSSIPISSKEYREKYPTLVSATISNNNPKGECVCILDDHGKPHRIIIDAPFVIHALITELNDNNIPVKDERWME